MLLLRILCGIRQREALELQQMARSQAYFRQHQKHHYYHQSALVVGGHFEESYDAMASRNEAVEVQAPQKATMNARKLTYPVEVEEEVMLIVSSVANHQQTNYMRWLDQELP
jgi:hypothetical protein